MGVVIKADKDSRGIGRPQVAMRSQLPRFLLVFCVEAHFSVCILYFISITFRCICSIFSKSCPV